MSAEATLSSLARPLLEAFSEGLERRLPDVRSSLEQASSESFPASLFLTVKRAEAEPVVVEVALHVRAGRCTLSAEVISEEGRVLGPALVSRLARDQEPVRDGNVINFVKQLGFFLQANFDSVVEALGGKSISYPEQESEVLAKLGRYSWGGARSYGHHLPSLNREEVQGEFLEAARSRLSTETGQELSPAELRLTSGATVRFELASQNRDIVGHVQWDYYGKLARSRITELIWQLQNVPEASQRLLVVGPSRATLNRWIKDFGRSSAKGIEFWHISDGQLERLD